MSDRKVLLCLPVEGADYRNVASDSRVKQCSQCKQDIYVSAASLMQAGAAAELVCTTCFAKTLVSDHGEVNVKGPSAAVRAMLKKERGVTDGEIDRAYAKFRETLR